MEPIQYKQFTMKELTRLSILEHSACLGLPVSKKLKEPLAQLHKRQKNDENEQYSEREVAFYISSVPFSFYLSITDAVPFRLAPVLLSSIIIHVIWNSFLL